MEEIFDVIKFWLNFGILAFRMLKTLVEDLIFNFD